MAVAVRDDYQVVMDEQRVEVRNMVLAGLDQIKNGNTKDFNEVCDRLENKYRIVVIAKCLQRFSK